MSDHYRGRPLREPAEPLEPVGLRPGIHHAGGLVEHHDRRLPDEGPGKSDPLPFAAADLRALGEPLAHHTVIALGQAHDKVVGAGQLRRRLHIRSFMARVAVADGDVTGCGLLVAYGKLEQHAEVVSQVLHRVVSYVHAVQFESTGFGVIKTADQLYQRALPSAVGPDYGRYFARWYLEVEAFQRGFWTAGIPERNSLEAESFAQPGGQSLRISRVG